MGRHPTIRSQVRELLQDGKTRTCMQILHQLDDLTSSDSLSSSLLQMARKGELETADRFGPRGGRGYRMKGRPGVHCLLSEQCVEDIYCNCPCFDCQKTDCFRPGCHCKKPNHPYRITAGIERY